MGQVDPNDARFMDILIMKKLWVKLIPMMEILILKKLYVKLWPLKLTLNCPLT